VGFCCISCRRIIDNNIGCEFSIDKSGDRESCEEFENGITNVSGECCHPELVEGFFEPN